MKMSTFFIFLAAIICLFVPFVLAKELDVGNPFDFIPDTCLCGDLVKLNGDIVGKACMCESCEEWPGKVLVFFLIPEGLDVMRFHLNELANDFNSQRLFQRWGITIK